MLHSGTRTAACVSVGQTSEYFTVYAADNVLSDLLVNGEVKETMEMFGLGIGNRDIYDSSAILCTLAFVMGGDECARLGRSLRQAVTTPAIIKLEGCSFVPLGHPEVSIFHFEPGNGCKPHSDTDSELGNVHLPPNTSCIIE